MLLNDPVPELDEDLMVTLSESSCPEITQPQVVVEIVSELVIVSARVVQPSLIVTSW